MNMTIKLSGIKHQHQNKSQLDICKEEFDRKGFVVIKNVFDKNWILKLQTAYDKAIIQNNNYYSSRNIKMTKKELGIIRQIYRFDNIFLEAVVQNEVIELVNNFIDDQWIITQQNGSHIDYDNPNQDSIGAQVWHRDFIFRHITTSKPILLNILIPLDKFTKESGATNILPFSHLFPEFPSNEYLKSNFTYAEADLGDIIVLNGLTYHSAGQNTKGVNRRSFNTVFAIPAIRHQVEPFPENASENFIKKYSNYLTAGYINNPQMLEFIKERNA
jgi:ectoine hydroxylase-related dioxygenase (phytanoyl-CoA dioxygenase family)